jgi:RNA polymerase sigma factor (sigma-70 family)
MKPAHISEDKLVRQFNKGDRKALAAVYDMWYPKLRYLAFKVTGNMTEAEDIAITTMEALFSRRENFPAMTNIKAFVYITVKNKCIKFLQSDHKQKISHRELSEFHGESDEFVLKQMIKSEMFKEIYNVIENLPSNPKDILKLFFIEGLEVNEIAEKLNKTPGSVSTAKSRAVEQLRSIVLDKKLLPATGILLVLREMFF